MNKLLSLNKTEKHLIITILGLKLKFNKYYYKNKISKKVQDKYDLSDLRNAKKINLFLVPDTCKIGGGVMSIYSICEYSREYCKDALCLIATYKSKYTHASNKEFKNNEKIYRWEQILKNLKNAEEMILHIPELFSGKFYAALDKKEIATLKNIPHLHINIMNQNIELMPEPEKIQNLFKLTDNVTQTTAHIRYATQEICNKWGIPTHLFSTWINFFNYKSYGFDEKEKIIVLSPDENEHKSRIVGKLKTELPDFNFITVANMTFSDYMDLIGRAYFTITFGEGMDGYYTMPHAVNSIGFAAYNNDFFPDKSWLEFKNIYSDYEEMEQKIVSDINFLINNPDEYRTIIDAFLVKYKEIIAEDKFQDNLKRFYQGNYDFYPQENKIKIQMIY